ncbi:helix-turn-helix transcriptional regulator [Flavobacteriaceae bacterium TP-CH-4]|uniref:Helix-turn-helix transcriptional regulator n=1 Tax=Pelagihabitans pacificus TaxID=2696054 RepID=A0A967AW69_9FLAO|nr:AraC family transcriptional regulator [Pelagihabitans pacificus]NHF60238.1 helix-turn-helix transcriptional regulator [Pelagihabitans pacificus]
MKVQPFKIPKPVQYNLIIQVDKGDTFYPLLHQHEEIQVSCVLSGQGKLIVSDSINPFTSGDIFVIGGQSPHLFQSATGGNRAYMISLFFTLESFGKGFFEVPELSEVNLFYDTIGGGIKICSKLKSIRKIMETLPKASKFERFLHFLRLIQKINAAKKRELAAFVSRKKISHTEGKRLQLVFEYVMNHFDKEITLSDIAMRSHMTPPSFCRFFKQHTNKTFFEFLMELRISHSCELLAGPLELPIAEIAEKSGFNSVSHFNRSFKRIKKMTPSSFKGKMTVATNYQ